MKSIGRQGKAVRHEAPPRSRLELTMDRILSSKWLFYIVIGLAVAYLWVHFESLRSAYRTLSADFWR